MEIVYERCAGLDVHKKNVKACFSSPGADGHRQKETRGYLTMTGNLLELRDWLKEQGCTHIAMEATGEYTPPTMLPIVGGVYSPPIDKNIASRWVKGHRIPGKIKSNKGKNTPSDRHDSACFLVHQNFLHKRCVHF